MLHLHILDFRGSEAVLFISCTPLTLCGMLYRPVQSSIRRAVLQQFVSFAKSALSRQSKHCRSFCTSIQHNQPDDTKQNTSSGVHVPPIIQRFNDVVEKDPDMAVICFMGTRVITWYALGALFTQLPSLGPEIALGYVMAKCTGKFRQPFNFACAAAYHKMFPVLSTIHASAFLGIIKPKGGHETEMSKKINDFFAKISGPVDKYGFSFYLAAKTSFFMTMFGTAAAMHYGYDISPTLEYLGISQTLQDGGSAFALATIANFVLLPVHIVGVMNVVPRLTKYKRHAYNS